MRRKLYLVVLVGIVTLASCNAPSTLQVSPVHGTLSPITPVLAVPVPSVTRVPLPAPTSTASPSPDVAMFTSRTLGISFNYLPAQGVKVQEIGDKVYVYVGNISPTEGQWIQVFKKDRADSLEEAIRKQFLPGYSAQDCLVVRMQDPVLSRVYPASYVLAQIDVPRTANDDMQTILPKAAKCPSPYTTTNFVAYFLTDTQHPDKFVFFHIGQYPIPGDHTRTWQATVQFTGEPTTAIE